MNSARRRVTRLRHRFLLSRLQLCQGRPQSLILAAESFQVFEQPLFLGPFPPQRAPELVHLPAELFPFVVVRQRPLPSSLAVSSPNTGNT